MKKIMVLVLSLLMVTCLGCNENVEAIQSVDDTQPVVIETVSDPEPEPVSEVVSEPVSEEPSEPEVDPNVELSMEYLKVSRDWLTEYSGLGFERENILYALTDEVPLENKTETGIGGAAVGYPYACVYCTGDTSKDRIILGDKFVVPTINDGDAVLWLGNSPLMTITLIPMEFYGYTVDALLDPDVCESLSIINDYDNIPDFTTIEYYKKKSFSLSDSNGVEMSDLRNLKYGESYVLRWKDNGDHEVTLVAANPYYKAKSDEIKLDGTATDDPTVVAYDFSSVPSGTYFVVERGGLVTVP